MRRSRALSFVSGLVLAVIAASSSTPVSADVILDGPNITGSVGLTGETFGSGSVSVSPIGFSSVGTPLVNGSFALRIEPGVGFHLSASMSSFQNASNGSVSINRFNQTALAIGEVRNFDLVQASGRVRSTVAVTGGALQSFSMSLSHSTTNQSTSGSASVGSGQSALELPFPALSGVTVSGTATVRIANTCNVSRSLAATPVSVTAGGVASVAWSVDVSGVSCSTSFGTISGEARLDGLATASPPATRTLDRMNASGASFNSTTLAGDGSYSIPNLAAGSNYLVYRDLFFAEPYRFSRLAWVSGVSVTANATTNVDVIAGAGTAHGNLITEGPWNFSHTNGTSGARLNWTSGSTFSGDDFFDRSSGAFDLVLSVGSSYVQSMTFNFFQSDATHSTSSSLSRSFPSTTSPLRFTTAGGTNTMLAPLTMQTSESLVAVQVLDPAVRITRLQLQGSATFRDPVTNAFLESASLSLNSIRTAPANAVSVLVRGIPGTYAMTAIALTDSGSTLSKPFQLVLGAPFNTPIGGGIEQPILGASGAQLGSITFGTVSGGGDTTVSLSSSGPKAPKDFKIYEGNPEGVGGDLAYYDIRSTASFDVATVCLSYDESNLNNPNQEQDLRLGHYVCDASGANCSWDDITLPGYPDLVNNEICGETDSFSIFALLLPLDDDADGVLNADDNCPATPNANQADLDGDGVGDACDSDRDGDGLTDDTDLCPLLSSPDNGDLDGDGIGDVCDADADGDAVTNGADNCPIDANPSQDDFDEDDFGDACDLDDDADGLADASDLCAGTSPGELTDASGCSSPQRFELACPVARAYRNHGEYVSCVAHEAERQVAAGLIDSLEKDAAVSAAGQSSIGSKK